MLRTLRINASIPCSEVSRGLLSTDLVLHVLSTITHPLPLNVVVVYGYGEIGVGAPAAIQEIP